MFREDEMEGKTTLNRQLGMREGITITTGTVVGVGLFHDRSSVRGHHGEQVLYCSLL